MISRMINGSKITRNKMQLYKNLNNKMIFGVCSGVADFTNIDTSVIRLATVVGALLTGSLVFWLYLLLAILLPVKK